MAVSPQKATNGLWFFCLLLFFLFLGLKLALVGMVAHWHWLWVLSPLLFPFSVGILVNVYAQVVSAWKRTKKTEGQ